MKLPLKKGTKVRVIPKFGHSSEYEAGIGNSMHDMCGKVVTLKEDLNTRTQCIKIEEDRDNWWWSVDMFEPINKKVVIHKLKLDE